MSKLLLLGVFAIVLSLFAVQHAAGQTATPTPTPTSTDVTATPTPTGEVQGETTVPSGAPATGFGGQ